MRLVLDTNIVIDDHPNHVSTTFFRANTRISTHRINKCEYWEIKALSHI